MIQPLKLIYDLAIEKNLPQAISRMHLQNRSDPLDLSLID